METIAKETIIIAITGALTIVALAIIFAYTKMRPLRSQERLAALERGQNADLFFSGRFLHYIPWQFWTSFAILVLLIVTYFVSSAFNLDRAQNSFLELIKYITGAVVGSLFGKSTERHASSGGSPNPASQGTLRDKAV